MTMKCPKCGAEFVDGITACTDCQTPLVQAEEAAEPVGEAAEVKILASFGDHLEVELMQGILEQRGIPSYVLERESGGYMKVFMGYTVFGEDLYVKSSDYEAAKECMEEYESLKVSDDQEKSGEEPSEKNEPLLQENDSEEGDMESGFGFKNPLIMENRHLAAIILLIAILILGIRAFSPPGF